MGGPMLPRTLLTLTLLMSILVACAPAQAELVDGPGPLVETSVGDHCTTNFCCRYYGYEIGDMKKDEPFLFVYYDHVDCS
jgi:hypothetical protein